MVALLPAPVARAPGKRHVGIRRVAAEDLGAEHVDGQQREVVDVNLVEGCGLASVAAQVVGGIQPQDGVVELEVRNRLVGRFGGEVFANAELVLVGNGHGREDSFLAVVAVGARDAHALAPLLVELGRGQITKATGGSGRGLLSKCHQKLVKMSR